MVSKGHADIIKAQRVRGKDKYPTEKPVALVKHCLEACLGPGGIVLDPFGGSGSTSMASEELGLHSVYIDVADEALDRASTRIEEAGGTVYKRIDPWLRAVGAKK